MSGSAWVVGVASTPFARMGDRTHASLAEEVVTASLKDAGTSGADVGRVWFGNCGMHAWGQPNIRGQVALKGMLRDGRLSSDAGVVNVEAACSTGSAVFADAVAAARAGAVDVALAVGVEKVFHPGDLQSTFGVFVGGADVEGRKEWLGYLAEQARLHDLPWAPHPARIVFVDVHALAAQHHMKTYGTTAEQLAYVAAKDHAHGALNPLAQYDTPTDPAEVLADKGVVGPFTRSMCCPVSDGAVSVVVVSDAGLQRLPPEVRARAVRVLAAELTGGRWRGLDEPSVVDRGVEKAFAVAGIEGGDVDVAEVHEARAWLAGDARVSAQAPDPWEQPDTDMSWAPLWRPLGRAWRDGLDADPASIWLPYQMLQHWPRAIEYHTGPKELKDKRQALTGAYLLDAATYAEAWLATDDPERKRMLEHTLVGVILEARDVTWYITNVNWVDAPATFDEYGADGLYDSVREGGEIGHLAQWAVLEVLDRADDAPACAALVPKLEALAEEAAALPEAVDAGENVESQTKRVHKKGRALARKVHKCADDTGRVEAIEEQMHEIWW